MYMFSHPATPKASSSPPYVPAKMRPSAAIGGASVASAVPKCQRTAPVLASSADQPPKPPATKSTSPRTIGGGCVPDPVTVCHVSCTAQLVSKDSATTPSPFETPSSTTFADAS